MGSLIVAPQPDDRPEATRVRCLNAELWSSNNFRNTLLVEGVSGCATCRFRFISKWIVTIGHLK